MDKETVYKCINTKTKQNIFPKQAVTIEATMTMLFVIKRNFLERYLEI